MGDTVGSASTDFCKLVIDKNVAYAIGLWCADGYHRTSSIGLSNTDPDLIHTFSEFLLGLFPQERLKIRIYEPDAYKRRTRAYHVYVNCRPLLRKFMAYKNIELSLSRKFIPAYFAGRFDGDGSVATDFYRDCRIVYGSRREAERDFEFAKQIGFKNCKIYVYKKARTFCLYFSRMETNRFLSLIYPYSVRLQKSVFVPRRDLIRLTSDQMAIF